MKKAKIIFWVATILIFLFEGVMPALTYNSEMSRQGIMHLGYPLYFIGMLTMFKVLGTLAILIPKVPSRLKEWAYAGLSFDFIAAFISIWAVDGFGPMLILPVVVFGVLMLSYTNWHKMQQISLPLQA